MDEYSWNIKICNNKINIFGNNLKRVKGYNAECIYLNYNCHNEIKIINKVNDLITLYTGPVYNIIYYKQEGNTCLLSNVYDSLIKPKEELKINGAILAQQLSGVHFPIDNIFDDIKRLDSSTVYNIEKGEVIYIKTAISYCANVNIVDIEKFVLNRVENLAKKNTEIALLLSAGYDSRLNLALALFCKNNYNVNITLWHQFKDKNEWNIANNIAKKYDLKITTTGRTQFNSEDQRLITDSEFIFRVPPIYRNNIPRWINYIKYIKSKNSNMVFGLGAEAHKGKFYSQIYNDKELKRKFSIDEYRIKILTNNLNIKCDYTRINSFMDDLMDKKNVFKDFKSQIDYVHYHTYVSNHLGHRCAVFNNMFNVPFPFLDDNFLSMAFSINHEIKVNYGIVKYMINKLDKGLNNYNYISANDYSLKNKPIYKRLNNRGINIFKSLKYKYKRKPRYKISAPYLGYYKKLKQYRYKNSSLNYFKTLLEGNKVNNNLHPDLVVQFLIYMKKLETEKNIYIHYT